MVIYILLQVVRVVVRQTVVKDNQIEFVEKNIFTSLLKESEIKYLLSRCENGTEDIISVRSKAFQALQKDIDDYSMKELVTLIQENPSILKRPILLSEKSLVVDMMMMKSQQ